MAWYGPTAQFPYGYFMFSAVWDESMPALTDTTTTSGRDARNYYYKTSAVSVDGRGGADDITGSRFDDYLRESGSGPNGWFLGASQSPTPGVNAASLDGGYGADHLIVSHGTTGSFLLDAGFGNDTLNVNGGSNVYLVGGDGADLFTFGWNFAGNAEIRDFKQGIDKIYLSTGWALENTASGAPASFTDGHGHHIVVDGVSHDTMAYLNHGNGYWY
jgi:hypothetical protein